MTKKLLTAGLVPDFIKIDVEGSASLVIAGGVRLLSVHRPVVYIELHGPEESQAVKKLLDDFDYTAFDISGETVDDPTDGWQSPLILKPRFEVK